VRHGRRDTTHGPIRERLRELGASVEDLGDVGKRIPDLLVGFCDHIFLVEAKGPDGELSDGQREFARTWKGAKPVVIRSPEEAQAWYLRERARLVKGKDTP